MSDRPVAEISVCHHTTLTTDSYPCPCGIRTLNPSKQAAADQKVQTARPIELSVSPLRCHLSYSSPVVWFIRSYVLISKSDIHLTNQPNHTIDGCHKAPYVCELFCKSNIWPTWVSFMQYIRNESPWSPGNFSDCSATQVVWTNCCRRCTWLNTRIDMLNMKVRDFPPFIKFSNTEFPTKNSFKQKLSSENRIDSSFLGWHCVGRYRLTDCQRNFLRPPSVSVQSGTHWRDR